MKDTGDQEFARRIKRLDAAAMFSGKSVPSRKCLSMIAFRCVRDPAEEDMLSESAFNTCVMSGTAVDSGIAFVEDLLEVVGDARKALFTDDKIERKVLSQMAKCTHPGIKEDLRAYKALHPLDPFKRWM